MLGLRPDAAAALAAAALCAVLAAADPAAAPRHGEPGEVGERQRVANLPPFLMQFKNAVHKSNRSGADRATRSAFHRWCGIAVNKEQGNEYDSDDLAAAAGIVGAEKLWHYNWKMSSEVRVNNVELVPMIKEPGHTLGVDVNDLPAAFQDGRGGVVKGWNEPDEGSQAGRDYNLRSNPEAFAQAWTSDMLAARAKGYTEFIGPAMAQDTCWLDYFLKACETTAGCKELVTYLAFHRYRLDCASYEAHPDNPGWRDDLSYLLTYYRIMQKYNARGFNIKGLVFDELGCLTPSWTFSGEEEQLRYMQQWYQLTLVKVKTGDAETISTIKHTNWIMPKGPDAHGGESYSLGMCTAQDGGANAAEDAVRAIQSLVTVAWFSISPGQNHLFTRGGGLSTLGQVYFDACKNVEETGGVPPGEVISEPTPTPVTPSPTPDGGDGDSSDSGDDPLDGAIAKIVAQVTGKVLFAASGENLEEGFGAGNPEEHAEDSDWRLVRVAAGRYRIVSRYADRALYASSSSNWGEGMGASNPSSEVGGDGEWNFVAQDGATLYRIVNALNNRCLYAAREGHFGAGSPASWVGDDGVWSVQVQRSSATPAPATPAPATPAPATPAPATPGPATPAPTTPVPATSAPTPAPTPTPTPAPTPMPTPAPTPTPTPAPQGGRDDELDGRRVRITNAAVQRALYAQAWLNWEWGFGVGATGAELGDAGVWRLELVIGNRYRIINEASNRALYAPSSSNWEKGLGAGSPPEKVGGDGEWKIIPQSGHHRYRLVNNENDRCLYATSSNWGQGLGAGSPETKVGVDGVWEFTFLN